MNTYMPFLSHIQILRKHVFRALCYVFALSCASFVFIDNIITYLKNSYTKIALNSDAIHTDFHISNDLTSISVFEVMTTNFKIAFIVGFLLALPLIIWEVWRFVSPALYRHERIFAKFLIICSFVFFYLGVIFGYFLIIPLFFQSALSWASKYANVMISYESYFNTLVVMVMIFGIIFEVPIIIALFGMSGILKSTDISKNRKIAFLLSMIIGAILAPPDVFSMCLIGLPLYAMIEISILFLIFFENKKTVDINKPLL
jgi:sec-independent protein translocase protein TatC